MAHGPRAVWGQQFRQLMHCLCPHSSHRRPCRLCPHQGPLTSTSGTTQGSRPRRRTICLTRCRSVCTPSRCRPTRRSTTGGTPVASLLRLMANASTSLRTATHSAKHFVLYHAALATIAAPPSSSPSTRSGGIRSATRGPRQRLRSQARAHKAHEYKRLIDRLFANVPKVSGPRSTDFAIGLSVIHGSRLQTGPEHRLLTCRAGHRTARRHIQQGRTSKPLRCVAEKRLSLIHI